MVGKSEIILMCLHYAHNMNSSIKKTVMMCTCEERKQQLIKQAKSLGLNIPDDCFVVARPYENYERSYGIFKQESFKSLTNLTKD